MYFELDDVTPASAPDLEAEGLAGWWVDWPGASYRGRAVAPADWTREQVHAALEDGAVYLGRNVMLGRLYSRVRVDLIRPRR